MLPIYRRSRDPLFFAQTTITRLIIENDSWYSLRLLTIFVVQASALRDHREDRLDVALLGAAVLLCGLEVLRMLSALAGGELVEGRGCPVLT